MLTQQKEAAITLTSSLVFIMLKALAVPDLGAFDCELTLTLLALFIVSLWAGRIIVGAKLKSFDERDKTIRYQAALIAVHGFGAVVMAYACILYLIHRDFQSVPLRQVLNMAYYGWISLYVFWSGSILILYRKGALHV
ncbi:MAG TPA: hypothetical protein PKH19_02165 [Candidatus Syntrophosphaera sp.]|nr:hypothetical protein [Candidatus Syntrophosphaera sp.]